MRARINPADALLSVAWLTDASERLAAFRQAIAALGQAVRVTGPPPLDGVAPDALVRAAQAALKSGWLDDLDWIAPGPAAVALYELMIALPAGPERRDLGRRVLTRLYDGTGSTFAAVATRMALGSGKALEPAAMRARVDLVLDLPVGTSVDADALALSLGTRRELAEKWVVRPSFGALPARRLAAKILEHAAREAVMRSQQGDPLPREILAGEWMRSTSKRLLGDREPLVWRHAAVARGLLAAVDPQLREQIDLELDPQLSPTEWRRAAVSLVATMVADPRGGLKACHKLLKTDVLRKDPGITAAMVWGLPRVVEAEPDAAEELLDLVSASHRPDVAEAVAALLSDIGHGSFGTRAAGMLRAVLASKLDSDPPALRGITQKTLQALDRERVDDLSESLRLALVAYETQGARAAYERAKVSLERAEQSLERIGQLDSGDDRALGESLSLLSDLDATLLETGRLWDLLWLGRRPGDVDSSQPEMDRVYDRLGRWLLDADDKEVQADSSRQWSRHRSLGDQRRLRALLHLVDTETARSAETARGDRSDADDAGTRVRNRVRRAILLLLRRLAVGPDASLHRIVCATLARGCDAAAREGVAEPCDIFLLIAQNIADRQSIQTLVEASTNEDVDAVLAAWSDFLDPSGGAPEPSRVESFADTGAQSLPAPAAAVTSARRMVRLSAGLAAGGSHRAEALRSTLLRLGRALEAVLAARGLSDLIDPATGSSPIEEIEESTDALRALFSGVGRRVLGQELGKPVLLVTAVPLSALVERALSMNSRADRHDLEAACAEIVVDLPAPLSSAISQALQRVQDLPVTAPADLLIIPLERRRAQLPDWLLPRRTIGAFYVVRALGAGGVSSVFVARRIEERHDSKAESFALKVPQYDPSTARSLSEQEFMTLFRDEAGALLSLPHHENLARFVTFDMAARPKPILVMEHIRGAGLDRLLRSRSLNAERAFGVLDGILGGLEAMHGVGVAHLDVKPSNVILRNGEMPVLVDFGLSGRKLRPGCGTLEYCAPEVIGLVPEGHSPSPLSADVYAFACTGFEVLTGEPLFSAPNETALISLHVAHDGWPDRLRRLAHRAGMREVSLVLAASLRRDPRARPAVGEVRAALRDVARKLLHAPWPFGASLKSVGA